LQHRRFNWTPGSTSVSRKWQPWPFELLSLLLGILLVLLILALTLGVGPASLT